MKTLIGILTLLLPALALAEGKRIFTNTKGDKIEASIVAATDETVTLRKGVKNYTIPIRDLSPDDQVFIKKFQEEEARNYIPNLDVRYQSGKSIVDKDYDDITQKMQPGVKITNRDLRFNMKDAKVTVLVFGESAEYRNFFRVLSKQSFKVSLGPGQEKEWTGEQFLVVYDELYAKHGHKYDGAVVIIQNESGKVIHSSGNPKFEKMPQKLLELQENADVDKNLNPVSISIY